MERHPVFNRICLHSDEELAAAFDSSIVERQTIHEWSLSCVQRLLLEDGTRLIYKSQLPPTVETEFYQRAVSPLLTGHRFMGTMDGCEMMTLDWIDAPSLQAAAAPSEREWIVHGRALLAQIGEIGGDPPANLNIGSVETWLSTAETTLRSLDELAQSVWAGSTRAENVNALRKWAESAPVRRCIMEKPRLIHGDLKPSQIFFDGNGYRVIDWQRPAVGPPEVDLASLLITQGIDARRHLAAEAIGVFWFLFLRWAVIAQSELFPGFAGPLFRRWSSVAARQILAEDAPSPPAGIPPA